MENSHQIVQTLWNYCKVLRDDLSAPDWERRSARCNGQAGRMSYLLARTAQAKDRSDKGSNPLMAL